MSGEGFIVQVPNTRPPFRVQMITLGEASGEHLETFSKRQGNVQKSSFKAIHYRQNLFFLALVNFGIGLLWFYNMSSFRLTSKLNLFVSLDIKG